MSKITHGVIVGRFSTLQRLEKISQAHKNMMKKKSSFEMLKKNFMEGLVSFVIHSVKEDYKVQALLLWITWLNIGALFYALKMDITFQRGIFMCVMSNFRIENVLFCKAFTLV